MVTRDQAFDISLKTAEIHLGYYDLVQRPHDGYEQLNARFPALIFMPLGDGSVWRKVYGE